MTSACARPISRSRIRAESKQSLVGDLGSPPDFLANGQKLEKPYGVKQTLRRAAGRSRQPGQRLCHSKNFLWGKSRAFGLTTELDLIALDRVKLVVPSEFHGVELLEGETLPVGFVKDRYAPRYAADAHGNPVGKGAFGYREGVKLTGTRKPGGFQENLKRRYGLRAGDQPALVTGA